MPEGLAALQVPPRRAGLGSCRGTGSGAGCVRGGPGCAGAGGDRCDELRAAGLGWRGRRGLCGCYRGVGALRRKGRAVWEVRGRGAACAGLGGQRAGLGSCGGAAVSSEHCWGHALEEMGVNGGGAGNAGQPTNVS